MFTTGEDGTLELLTRGPVPSHHYEKDPYYLADPSPSSASNGIFSYWNPYAGPYYPFVMTSQGYPIATPIFWPPAGISSSTSSGASTDHDCIEEYPKITGNTYSNPTIEAHHISMVDPTRAPSRNSSSRYPTIMGSEASYA
jgi:hypothetical protein